MEKVGLISCGLDPGMFSLNRLYVIEYSLNLDSNPEFTGAKTVFDIAPAYLSPIAPEELRAYFL